MNSKTVEKAIVCIVIAAIALIILGTVSIPAFLAISYGWAWLLVYPAALIIVFLLAYKRKR